MTDEAHYDQHISELEAALKLPLPDAARQQIEIALHQLRAERSNLAVGNTVGRDLVQVSGGTLISNNYGTIMIGRELRDEERQRLSWYLERLAARLRRLSLRGLDPQLDAEHGGLPMERAYVTLATTQRVIAASGSAHTLASYFEQGDPAGLLARAYQPDSTLPGDAIVAVHTSTEHMNDPQISADKHVVLFRAQLAAEAVARHQHLVLLGDPGGGKSTFVRHLAWALALRNLNPQDSAPELTGWEEGRPCLPIVLPLRRLAAHLAGTGTHNGRTYRGRRHDSSSTAPPTDAVVYAALHDEILSYGVTQIDDILNDAFQSGTVIALFDGLDEVPLRAVAGVSAGRAATLAAVQDFAHVYHRTRIVITCRTRAFDALQPQDDWQINTLAPFTLGQMRYFAGMWYRELARSGRLHTEQAARLERELIEAISSSRTLRSMAETPLLLTMMGLVLYHDGALPRDRPQVYERVLELLLGQWDKLREGQSLAEAIGQPEWDSQRILPVLEQLSFEAHEAALSDDGRGRLARAAVSDALIRFFDLAHVDHPWETAQRCLEYFEQRSGLLVPDGPDTYVFAHLTLQEHCAGRRMLLAPDAIEQVLKRRNDDRWREPILLGLGVVQKTNPALIESIISSLIDYEEHQQRKPAALRQRDLILAAEIGRDRDWNYLRTQRVQVDRLIRDLRKGLTGALYNARQPSPAPERVRTATLLGELGDPRFPVSIADWQRELERVRRGMSAHDRRRPYFCRVEPGRYLIGSSDADPDAEDSEKPQHVIHFDAPFWIARFPITNAQWQEWVRAGGQQSLYWRESDINGPNQPVVGVSWRVCNAFCTWLSTQLGVTIRLPSEVEWEAAARGKTARRYPWGDEWHTDHAAIDGAPLLSGRAVNVPVGCYPAGAALCGALDLAGNVGEWTADVWHSYPGARRPFTDVKSIVVRGGGALRDQISVRCAARSRDFFLSGEMIGFRVLLLG